MDHLLASLSTILHALATTCTLPLSIFGLILTFIEVISPQTADRIERCLDELNRIRSPRHPWFYKFMIPVEAVGMMVIYILFFLNIESLMNLRSPPYTIVFLAIMLVGIIAPITVAIIVVYATANFISACNKLAHGRALGAFGLMVSVVGICFEFYIRFF